MRTEVFVGGFDTASVASGVSYVMGSWDGAEAVEFEFIYERAYKIENTFVSRYKYSQCMLEDSLSIKDKFGLDLCSIEDYINTANSHVSFSMGEFGGLVRGVHYAAGFPLLLTRPVIMRSFIADGRKLQTGQAGKRQLVQWVKEDFGFESKMKYAKERSDCSDATIHAIIGVYTLLFLNGAPLELLSVKRQETFKHPKKCTGILDNLSSRLCTTIECSK
jgi:hypothetical protein